MAVIFDSFGVLIAHPDYARFVDYAISHGFNRRLPDIAEIRSGLVGAVMRRWNGGDHYEGSVRGEGGRDYLFRLQKFSQSDQSGGYSLLLAAQDDFAQNVRELQIRGLIIALIAGSCFIPAVWIFGGRMSTSLKRITAQASRLRRLAAPDNGAVTSRVKEIDELGRTTAVARRTRLVFCSLCPGRCRQRNRRRLHFH
jgi:adenylate cyclase